MRVLEQTLQIVSATDGAVWSVDQVRQQLNLLSVIGLESSRHMIETLSLKETVEGWVVEHSEPLLIPNINLDERFNVPLELQQEDYAYLGLPMRTRGQVMGVLVLLRTGKPFNLEEITLISSIADHIALIIDNLSLYHFYEQAAISEERSRLARDLHDSATQSLFSVTLYAEASRTTAQKGDLAQTEQYLERLSQTAHLALQEMRLLVYELRPPLLEQDGLAVTLRKRLESVEGRAGIQAQTQIDNLVYLDPLQEEHLFWIAMESLNNSLRHAAATQVEVTLKKEENQVVFIVRDNGRGYNLENARQSGGMGLQNMLQRAQKIGARLDINTAPGSGTTVTVFLPLSQANPDR